MSRRRYSSVIENYLSRALHQRMAKLSRVAYGVPKTFINDMKLKDEIQLKKFQLIQLCQFIYEPHFRLGTKPQVNLIRPPIPIPTQNSRMPLVPKSASLKQSLIQSLKKLSTNKNIYMSYIETQQLVSMMTPEQAVENRKQLIFIYKWIFNQKTWINQEMEDLGMGLKKVVIGKIREGYDKCAGDKDKLREELDEMEAKSRSNMEDKQIDQQNNKTIKYILKETSNQHANISQIQQKKQ